MSYARTALLLAGLTGLFLAVGYMLGGEAGMAIALVVALAMNVFSYWNSDKLILRMHGARQVDRQSAPQLHGIVEQLADKHAMFQSGPAIERIKMCQDCRVIAQFENVDDPFAAGPRPTVRTTDDYLREREEIEEARARFKAGQSDPDGEEGKGSA